MKVADKLYVAIDYTLALDSGEEVDRSQEGKPMGFVAGAGQILPGLEKALMGRSSGENFKITLSPGEGYGPVDQGLIQEIPKARFPEGAALEPGMFFQARGPRGPMLLTVKEVRDEVVVADLNHPLAGKTLHFDVTVVQVREPNALELESLSGGCACGPTGGGESCGPDSGCACG